MKLIAPCGFVFCQMTGDLGEGEQALVDLKLQNFRFLFTKSDPWTKNIEVSLHSLVMEDLLQVNSPFLENSQRKFTLGGL